MDPALRDTLQYQLQSTITRVTPVAGGDINAAYRLYTGNGDFFIKTNRTPQATTMFTAEARGLGLLGQTARVPRVIARGHLPIDGTAYLVLEWLDSGSPGAGFWPDFGRMLARVHQCSAERFGLDHDNFIGSLPQQNSREADWPSFYARHRLEPQFRVARDHGLLTAGDATALDRLCRQLPDLYPAEPPALLHGDLWSGNFLCHAAGQPVLIDPAVYFGHRELDLAMMQLFGGFAPPLFTAYDEAFPLAPGWPERLPVGQLYYLLVHVNLFGKSYVPAVRRILGMF